MAVIPSASILRNVENIAEVIARCDRTLSYTIDTVHMKGVQLPNAVPVNTGSIILELVDDCHIKSLRNA